MTWTIYKEIKICAAHQLKLPYESKCNGLHGHNYRVEVWLKSPRLNANDMVADFSFISKKVMAYDHKNLNELMGFKSTAENFANQLYADIWSLLDENEDYNLHVRVWETDTSYAEFDTDDAKKD